MRRFFLSSGFGYVCLFKACFSDPLAESIFRETEPVVAVQFTRLLELVFQQIKDDQSSARSQNFEGRSQGCLRVFSVVKGLAEQRQVYAAIGEGGFFDVSLDVFEILEPIALREVAADFDHARRAVDAVDVFMLVIPAYVGNAHAPFGHDLAHTCA